MHAVIRSYSGKGTKALFDLLEKNKGEVQASQGVMWIVLMHTSASAR